METDTDKLLKSVIETLIKKEAPKFKSLIQKELASRIHDKIEELKKALSGQIVTGVQDKKEEETPVVALPENLPGAPSAPPVTAPTKAGDLRIVPTAAGAGKDDISLDPNFEKEFYHSSEKYKNQEVIIKQQENYIETRKRIDEATSGNRSVSDAVDRLRLRQQKRSER